MELLGANWLRIIAALILFGLLLGILLADYEYRHDHPRPYHQVRDDDPDPLDWWGA